MNNKFSKVLNLIKSDEIRHQTEIAISHIPEYFYEVAASSSGKYHPRYALGAGGLYRHTLAAIKLINDISKLKMMKLSSDDIDYCISAMTLHDSRKLGLDKSEWTKHEHPMLAVELVYQYCDLAYADKVAPLIASHMGQWTSDSHSEVVLPEPSTKLQMLVHLCDYLASRKYIEINLDDLID